MSVRRVASIIVTALILAGLAGLSRLPMRSSGDDAALVRLSWRLLGVHLEECRTLSDEEYDALPAHMRRREECTGRVADYELELRVDQQTAVLDTVRSAGTRGDRPVFVLRDVPVAPGPHAIEVRFEALLDDDDAVATDVVLDYAWSGTVDLVPNEIAVLTFDPAGTRIVRVPR